jgi:hypothetical protein
MRAQRKEAIMARDPKEAAEKRSFPVAPGSNSQSAPDGSAHRPEEFTAMNPARQRDEPSAETGPDVAQSADSDRAGLTREQRRVRPAEVRRHALAQGTDDPAIPRGRNPDSAMCEDSDHPGMIDKDNDC